MKRLLIALSLFSALAGVVACSGVSGADEIKTYTNPVIDRDAPDPTVIRGKDGVFYAYATWRDRNVPVYKSTDMINWEYVGGVFEQGKVPMYVNGGAIWAPDINTLKENMSSTSQCPLGAASGRLALVAQCRIRLQARSIAIRCLSVAVKLG